MSIPQWPENLQPPSSAPRPTSAPYRVRLRRSPYFPVMMGLLGLLLAMLVLPAFMQRISYYMARGRQQAAREQLDGLTPTSFSKTSRLVADAVQRSVVIISTRSDLVDANVAERLGQFEAGQGSGVVVDEQGYVLTNQHVIASANEIFVRLSDSYAVRADVVGVDAYTDLAVLKIAADGLTAIPWGDSDALASGDPVWAFGSPYGLDQSITFGIVSAKGRSGIGRSRYQDLLQTDAAVNPGNSGGALVNAQGELVGINTAIVGQSYRGISFAIPSNMAREVFELLKERGQFARGYLGVQLTNVSVELAEELGQDKPRGAVVNFVLDGTPAAASGLKVGDVITEWNGEKVADPRELSLQVAATEPDSLAKVAIIRDGDELVLDVKVGRLPAVAR